MSEVAVVPQPLHLTTPSRIDALASLNEQQRAAVEHGLDGDARLAPPLLVIAGAGSGKTKTLAARLARLVLAGCDPQRILLLTFSRRAALEMTQRAGALLQVSLGLRSGQRPHLEWAGTFHSVAARLLRLYAPRLGLSDAFTVLDRGDAEDLLDVVRDRLGFSKTKKRFPTKGTCFGIYSRVLNSGGALLSVLQDHYPWCLDWADELKVLFQGYADTKQDQQLLDFDDLLLSWSLMLEDPALATEVGTRFDHVLVDEYQDTNRLQALILRRLKPSGRGVVAVGDDAQAIYSFRAAEVRNILDFGSHFDTSAERVTLERNYRSTQPILAASNAVIALAAERHTKQLWTDRTSSNKPLLVSVEDELAQARWVADRVLAQRESGMLLKHQAVLFRTAHHSAALELELVRRNIPFVKFGGLKFLESTHIKDVLAVLRWASNPHNEVAGFRVAKLMPGVGPATARRLVEAVTAAPSALEALASFEAPAAARESLRCFGELFGRLAGGQGAWPAELEDVLLWYVPLLEQASDDAAVRVADLRQLVQIAGGYRSRERFLTELALDPPAASSDESGDAHLDEDYLILSTLHSAKGQEWRSVSILNVVDGCIPCDIITGSASLIEEERRLLYVGMTRAKEQLHLLVPQRYYMTQQAAYGDRHVYAALTRFIPPAIQHHFEAVGPVAPEGVPSVVASGPSINVLSRVRQRWG
ncbi:ATP-dependent helicase [Methylibium rhizosphaerae]|uniref:ATP-dependent helicase n=1 Tax=Methylibium rhizosphaerae TaxID=2570323 RepID=UPI001129A7A6|nr:ATP-dependent helicase [Methylibium rhizosphaerae]